MKMKWELTGLEDYMIALEQAGQNVNTVSREVLDSEVGPALRSAMQARCPSDKLRPYIKIFIPSAEGDYNYIAVGYVRDLDYTPKEIAIAANSVEFGSVHNAAMPHIRPAVRAMRSFVNQTIAARLKAAGYVD